MAYYDVELWMRQARWRLRRGQAKRRWGRDVVAKQPIVVVNAIPKSGSHLLTQVVEGILTMSPLVDTGMPPLNRGGRNVKYGADAPIRDRIGQLRPADFAYGYLNANENYVPLLREDPFAVLFSYRDPRDVVVSQIKYATYMKKDHHMHAFYNEKFEDDEARINAAICGIEDETFGISSILRRYEGYLGWMDVATVLPVKFEDLILAREDAFERILRFLEERGLHLGGSKAEVLASMHAAVQPKKSGTFRKGTPGGWKEAFSAENKRVFKQETGDLLVRLGYEKDLNW